MFSPQKYKITNIAKTININLNTAQNEIHGKIFSGLLGRLPRTNSKAVPTNIEYRRIMFY